MICRFTVLLFFLGISGCASNPDRDPRDPWEPMNRKINSFNEVVDENLAQPVARLYRDNIHLEIRSRIGNFFGNLTDPIMGVNNVLQGKGGQEGEAHDDADRHDGERQQVSRRRPALRAQQEETKPEDPGEAGASDGEEHRVERLHGNPGRGQRSAEDDDPDQSVDPTARRPVHGTLLSQGAYGLSGLAVPATVRYG